MADRQWMWTLAILLPVTWINAGWAAPPPSTLDRARAAYENRADIEKAKRAVSLFAQAAEERPQSYAAHWEAARAIYYLWTFPQGDGPKQEMRAVFQRGIDLCRRAVELKPDGVEGHFWLGVLYGRYGEAKGILKSLKLVPVIRKEMETCMELDESVECYGPCRVLGRMFYKLPGFKGGDNRKSMEILVKGIDGCPTNALARLYLAETYEDEGYDDLARQQIIEIRALKDEPRWAAEYPYILRDAEALMRKL